MTQQDLGEAVGISNRMVAYYEVQNGNPPATLLTRLAKTLGVTADELLGGKGKAVSTVPNNLPLWRKLRRVERLSEEQRAAVVRLIDAMLKGTPVSASRRRSSNDARGRAPQRAVS